MNFLINLIVSGLVVFLAAYITPGVVVDGFFPAIIVAVVLGVLNATIGTVLRFFTFPLNFLTFGLVSSVVGFFMLLLTDSLVIGFSISNWLSGIVFACLLGIISSLFSMNIKPKK